MIATFAEMAKCLLVIVAGIVGAFVLLSAIIIALLIQKAIRLALPAFYIVVAAVVWGSFTWWIVTP